MTPQGAELIALHGEAAASEAAQHALWRAGDLSWMLHEGTTPAHRAECRRLGLMDGTAPEDWTGIGQVSIDAAIETARERGVRRFVGEIGRRFGKSHYLVVRATQKCLRKPNTRIPYAASTGKSLEEFILPIARGIIATAPPDIRPELVGGELRFHNGSRIPFQGCEDEVKADRLRGPASDEVMIDEAGFIAVLEYVIDSVFKYQLGTTDGMMLVFSSPPDTPAHYFAKLAEGARKVQAYSHATIYDGPFLTPNALVKLCNPDGDPEALPECEAATPWQREALARRVVDSIRAIVPEFSAALADRVRPIVCETPRPDWFHAYTCGDLGYVDLTVILFAYWHFGLACIVVEDEIVLERATSDIIQREVDIVEGRLWTNGLVEKPKRTLDAPPITRADMARVGETADHEWQPPRKADKEAGVNALRNDVARRKYRINPRCTTLIAHLTSGIWNKRRTDFERSEGLGHFDGVAAAVYLSRAVDRNRNPNPPVVYDGTDLHVPQELRNVARSGWAAMAAPRKR